MPALRPALTLLLLALVAAPTLAQSIVEVEIDRPADELHRALVDPVDPSDPDAVDSALVFTSDGGPAAVRCSARDGNGDPIGSPVIVPVPARGLRWLRASDLSDGADFVGSARCTSLGAVSGSGFVLGPNGATNLRAQQHSKRARGRRHVFHVRFPVVASY